MSRRALRVVARAEELVREQRVEDALLELQSALKIDPRSAALNQRLAELYSEKGAVQLAVLHFGEAYRLDPERVEAALRQAALEEVREHGIELTASEELIRARALYAGLVGEQQRDDKLTATSTASAQPIASPHVRQHRFPSAGHPPLTTRYTALRQQQ